MTKLRVLVKRESSGEHVPVWVAQALEEDLATQVLPDETALDAVAALGDMFDIRDAAVADYATRGVTIEPPPVTPKSYHRLWESGTPLGEHPLGTKRVAEVRSCNS
jgi:hypothetical protein